MTKILIPTDFDVNSVYHAYDILPNFVNKQVTFIFFHAYKLSDSISDLLMLSRRTAEYGQVPENFHKACHDLRQQNKRTIAAVGIEYFYGNTVAAFRNFAEAQEIDAIFYPADYNFKKISKYSIDPAVLLSKSGITMIRPLPKIAIMQEKLPVEQVAEMA